MHGSDRNTLVPAAAGMRRAWWAKSERKLPSYATQWLELLGIGTHLNEVMQKKLVFCKDTAYIWAKGSKGGRMFFSDEEEVRAVLAAYHDATFQLAQRAWQKWQALGLAGQLRYPGRSRACLVHDFIVQEAIAAWSENEAVRVIEKDETAKFVFNDRVVGRFKKADDRGLGSNIPTQAALDFTDQQQELPGIPNVHKVEILYTLNRLQTQIERIDVVARDRDVMLWSYQIEPSADASAEIIPLSITPAGGTRGATVKVKQPKPDVRKKSETSE